MAIVQYLKGFFDRQYEIQAKNHCNTCSVGKWVVYREHHLTEKKQGGFYLKSLLNRFRSSRCDAAVSPAEATCAATIPTEEKCLDQKILVVCKGAEFSGNVMDYAVDMAAKTKCGLVALNLDERGHDFTNFCTESEKNISSFSAKAEQAGLTFNHVVRHGAEDSVVAELHCADNSFRYVMEDIAAHTSTDRIIPVYTRATLRVK